MGALILTLPPDESDEVVAALADDTVQTNALWRAMRDRGYPVPVTTSVARHRRGMCSCG
jgi:ActR/RegA family two-component response regulator